MIVLKNIFININIVILWIQQQKKREHKIIQGTSKLLTKNHSNIMMRCLNNNRIVIAVEYKKLQILE